MSKRVRLALVIFAMSALWFGIRISNANSTMTTDESLWHGRSANFYLALVKGEYQHTYQMAHPGVPVMWSGGLGVLATCPEYIHTDGFYVRDLAQSSESFREIGCDPHRVLIAERIAKVAFQALMFAASLWLLSTLIPLKGVVFAGLLMALSPWQAGLDQLLHVDGMFATASVLTLCAAAAMTWRSIRFPDDQWQRSVAGWFGVGFCLALATLTRSAGIVFLLPIGIGVLAAAVSRSRSQHRPALSNTTVVSTLRSGISVVLGCVTGIVALFPALWVAPGDVAERLFGFTDNAISVGHELALYYNGEIVDGDPGPMFYLDVLLWRSTPVELVALIAAGALAVFGLIWLLNNRTGDDQPVISPAWIMLGMSVAFIVLYATGITVAAKKFERYFIIVSSIIAILGGVAFAEFRRMMPRPHFRKGLTVVVTALLIVQTLSLAGSRPYMLDYFQPMVGGHVAAKTKFQLGWGHGGDQVTEWLVGKADGEPLTVRSSSTIGVFSVFVPLDSQVRFVHGSVDSVSAWYHTDYYVSGFQQTQRGLDRSAHLFNDVEPVNSVRVGEVVYFETYAVSSQPVPEALWSKSSCQHIVGSGVQLMAVEQRGENTLMILRVTDSSAAENAWIALNQGDALRIPSVDLSDGALVGVVFPDVQAQNVSHVSLGDHTQGWTWNFPSGDCQP